MLLKLNFVLCLIFLTCENFSSSKASSYFLAAKDHLPSINVTASKSNQGDHFLSRSLKTIEDVFDCSSGSWSSSSNCTELLRTINKENKITLPKKESLWIEVPLADTKNASSYDPPVNPATTAENIHPKPIKTDLVDDSRKKRQIRPSGFTNKSPSKRNVRTAKKSAKTTKIGSVQFVLKKIFPEDFFTMKPTSGKGNRKPPDFTPKSKGKRKRVTKPAARRLGKVYFRAGEENTTDTLETSTANDSTEAPTTQQNGDNSTTSQTEPQLNTTTATETQTEIVTEKSEPEQTGPVPVPEQPENETSTENPENITTSIGQNVNYHYHFHYFGGVVPPTLATID